MKKFTLGLAAIALVVSASLALSGQFEDLFTKTYILPNIQNYPTASLPTAGVAGRLAYDSTVEAIMVDNSAEFWSVGGKLGAAQTLSTTAASETLTPSSAVIILECNRAAGADTAITLSETGAVAGQWFIAVVSGSNNAGTCSFADSAGVQQGSAATLDDHDSITFVYAGSQWTQVATSNN